MNQLKNILKDVGKGFVDSVKGTLIVFNIDGEVNAKLQAAAEKFENDKRPEESKVWKRVLNCGFLNGGVFLLSIYLFEYGLLRGLKVLLHLLIGSAGNGAYVWSWMETFLSLTFDVIWVMPLFLLSRIVNSLWFQDIADSAYKYRNGKPQMMPSISKFIADILFSLVVQALFLGQSMIVGLVNIYYIGSILSFIHMCMLYSLYSFEYKWFNKAWELHKRLTFIEYNWPYFIGFGMPLTILTQLPSSYIVSGCIFAILFPLFILSANDASPPANISVFPLKLFSPVVAISNAMFSKSPATPSSLQSSMASTPIHQQYQNQRLSSTAKMSATDGSTSRRAAASSSHRSSPSSSSSHRSSPATSHRNSPSLNTRSSTSSQRNIR